MREWWGNMADEDDNVEEQWALQKIGGGNIWKEYWQIRKMTRPISPPWLWRLWKNVRLSPSEGGWGSHVFKNCPGSLEAGRLRDHSGGWGWKVVTVPTPEFWGYQGRLVREEAAAHRAAGRRKEWVYLHKHFTFSFGIFCGKSAAIPWGQIALLWHCLLSSSWLTVTKHFRR